MDDGRHRLLWELGSVLPQTEMPSSDGALSDTSSGRCYWSLLDADFKIRYVDPTYALHMAQQADLAIGSSLFDFIHPQELQAAKRDYLAFLEGRTLFGTVTRCRFMRMSAMRKKFGAPADIPPQPPLERPDADDEYMPCKIVSSWIGDGTILCFFHAIVDRDPVADSNEEMPSAWTNWCGPRTGNPTELYLTPSEQARISEVMTESEREAHEKPGGRPDLATATGDPAATPRYVFQILSGSDAQLILSHPPPNVVQYGEERDRTYDPYEYARLAREVWEKPREKNTDANTSCTRRFRSKHPIMRDGNLTTIDSVVIRYSSLCFACFQTRDTFSNRERGPFVNYPMGVSAAPMPTFRGEDRLSAPFPLATYGKRRRDDEEEEVPGHKPAPLMLQNAAGGPIRPFYEADNFNDAISPTVASGAAILGSFQNYRPPLPHEPPYHYNQSGTAVSSSFPQNTYDVYTSGYDYLGPNSNGGTPNGSTNGSNGLPPLQMPPFMSYHSPQYNEYGHMSPYQPQPPPAAAPSVSRHPVSPQSGAQPSPDLLNMGPPRSPAIPASPASSTTHRGVPKSSKASTAGQVTPHPGGRACASCGTTNSPEWRKGPNGVKSLCNACGLRFARSQARQAKKLAQEQATAEGRPLPVEPPKKKGKKGKPAVASNAASTSASVDHAIPAQGQGTAALLPEDHPNLNESYGFPSSYGGVYDPALGLSANSSNENW